MFRHHLYFRSVGPVSLSARRWNPELGVYEDSAVIDNVRSVTVAGGGNNRSISSKAEKQTPVPIKKSAGDSRHPASVASPASSAGFAWSSFQDSPAPITLPSFKEVTASWDTDGPLSPSAALLPDKRVVTNVPLLMPKQGQSPSNPSGAVTAPVAPLPPGDGRRAVSLGELFGPGVVRSNQASSDLQKGGTFSLPYTPGVSFKGVIPSKPLGAPKPVLLPQVPPSGSHVPKQVISPQSLPSGLPLRPSIKDFPMLGPFPPLLGFSAQVKMAPRFRASSPELPSIISMPSNTGTSSAPAKKSLLVPSSAMRRKV